MRAWLLVAVLVAACGGDDDGASVDAGQTPDSGVQADAEGSDVCGLTVQSPEPDGDIRYDDWQVQGCFDRPCLCADAARPFVEDVLACRAVEGGYYWGLGSEYVRITGRSGDDCIVRVGNDIEGSVTVYECALPLPVQPWPGIASTDDSGYVDFLDGIEDLCTEEGTCSLLGGGPNPCWEDTDLAAPYCTAASDVSCP
jgi:hypothetical protein